MSSNTKVKVTANPDTGNVVTESTNPEFAYIRVEQERTSLENGFLNKQTRSAIIGGRTEELNELGWEAGKTLPGQIIVEEQLEPFYNNQDPKINPETGEILKVDGQPIYRQSRYTENMKLSDDLIQHDTVSQQSEAPEEQETEEEVSITA